ncbi:MAG: ArnT family glycosyltransferase [Lentisphaeria bacterium]|jgi:4-amino-4-deoxy-L-arabinose transferase-like glycosyltransferase
MLYIERQPSSRSIIFLIVLAPVLYLFSLTMLEVRSGDEAVYAAMAKDMVATGNFLKTHLYGRPINAFPLYTWLTVICSGFQSPSTFTLRLPAVLALWALAVISGLFAKRLQGPFAGTVAAAMVLTCVVSFRVGSRAQSEILHTLLLSAAWFSWYYWGQERKQWYRAWGIAMACLFLAVLAVGAKAIFFFYFPMLFMRRSLNLPHHLQSPAHICMVTLFAIAVTAWLFITPNQPFLTWNTTIAAAAATRPTAGYFSRLFHFPWKCLLYLCPWAIFIWAPFCLALHQFEQSSTACRYLRTIIFSHALLFWLLPRTSPLDLLPVFGALAVLIGIHFEIVIRRYQHIFIRVIKISAWIVIVISALAAIAWLGVSNDVFIIEGFSPMRAGACAALLIINAAVTHAQIIRPKTKRTFRSSLLWCICGFRILSIGLVLTLLTWANSDRRLTAQALAGHAPAEYVSRPDDNATPQPVEPAPTVTLASLDDEVDVVYLHSTPRELFLVETFYLGKRIIQIDNPAQELPADAKTVFVLAPREPAVPSRAWEAISPKVDMTLRRRVNIDINRLERRRDGGNDEALVVISRRPYPRWPDYTPKLFRLYRGVLR